VTGNIGRVGLAIEEIGDDTLEVGLYAVLDIDGLDELTVLRLTGGGGGEACQ
jgi:hypothetical protein